MLGQREPEVYGKSSLKDIQEYTKSKVQAVEAVWQQSNNEYEIIELIQQAKGKFDGLIINPGAYSHTSLAIYDAMKSVEMPIIEVHLSNTHARESFRSRRITAKAAHGVLEGLGKDVYYLGILALSQ